MQPGIGLIYLCTSVCLPAALCSRFDGIELFALFVTLSSHLLHVSLPWESHDVWLTTSTDMIVFNLVITMSSESKCHFRGVMFCCVPGVLPLHKRRGILLPPGASQGACQENDTCFPLFCCVCNLGTSVTFAWVQGEVPRGLPSAREIPKRKMTL